MRLDRLTTKTREALVASEQLATSASNPALGSACTPQTPKPTEVLPSGPASDSAWCSRADRRLVSVGNGGGLHFIAETDIAIAADSATFFDTHCASGLAAVVEMVGLARKIPLEAVFRLSYMGSVERMSAEDAKGLGLIGEIVPAANLMDRAREVAEIVCRWSPTALARTKQAIWESLDYGLEDALEKTHKILDVHADHGDMIEGATAFMEKRTPNWAPFDGKAVDIS